MNSNCSICYLELLTCYFLNSIFPKLYNVIYRLWYIVVHTWYTQVHSCTFTTLYSMNNNIKKLKNERVCRDIKTKKAHASNLIKLTTSI